ncbi:unnamed protein product [Adineta steineri]|uniref:F-box domain-containing protein n=1 Tax=Adineta steineri TaxID=433720 RepID=A0A815NHG1_9BILA|nr:unnamed protein product [Adineta steineri]
MSNRIINLLDLPDEILLIIFNKLGSFYVLYSLLNSTQRLDLIARSIHYSKSINFSTELSDGQVSTIDSDKLHRFCVEILPQIHDHIQIITLETTSIERILLAAQFPNLNTLVLVGFSPEILSSYFTEKSPIIHLLKEQIKFITLKIRNEMFNDISYTYICERVLSVCEKCTYLDIKQSEMVRFSRFSIDDYSQNICYSSYLHTLIIRVRTFDDCLFLLDGRLKSLSSLTVRVSFIERLSIITDSREQLFHLKEFSLECPRFSTAYDCRIVRLLHRMINLNKLTLSFYIIRLKVIDGIDLNEKILCHMLDLDKFLFHICTIMPTYQTNNFLSTNDIQNTFINWKYSQVGCSIDRFSNGITYCHIYSIPFQMTNFMYLTNSIRNDYFQFVINLTLYDTRPFEYDFFQWMSKAIPLLRYLTLSNFLPQVKKLENQSCIPYNRLVRIRFTRAHIDYIYQFLCHTKAYVPQLSILKIQYDKLVTITNNFTNVTTQINCSQLKQLLFDEIIVYPEHFHDYFPCLTK